MRLNWGAIGAIIPLSAVIFGWAISIEVRLTQHSEIGTIKGDLNILKEEMHQDAQKLTDEIIGYSAEVRGLTRRIQNIEEILTPVLVDFKVRKELEKALLPPLPPAPALPSPEQKPIEDKATKWAKDAIQKGIKK
jgi:hypothetical protein